MFFDGQLAAGFLGTVRSALIGGTPSCPGRGQSSGTGKGGSP